MVIEMVYTFEAENFNQIYRKVFDTVMSEGHEISPRGKRTKELNPAIIKINNPRQRYCSSRAGFNLPFSIAEVLWILKGVGDNEMISHYLKSFSQFLDPGYDEFHGAYGLRLRRWGYDTWGERGNDKFVDQLQMVYEKLYNDPSTRQAVMTLWNPRTDNDRISRDIPCNNWAHLMIRDGKLNWTQVIRSNDLIWGTPQNIFQFTHLQEIIAGWLNVDVGHYIQFSDSLHVYLDDFYDVEERKPDTTDMYEVYNIKNPLDMRMEKDKFDSMVFDMMIYESKWRNGNNLHKIELDNMYWQNFMDVLYCYNMEKHTSSFEHIQDTIDNMSPEFKYPMQKWLNKRVKKYEVKN